jgi:RNA polymerase sigma factor (sigma-70 family)
MDEIQHLIDKIDTSFIVDREKEAEYIKNAKEGDKESQHALVCSNILLVVKLASEHKSYAENFYNKDLDIHDLVMEGILGVYDAIEKYDFDKKVNGKNVKFVTYAWWWIRRRIQRAVDKHGSLVHRPVNVRQEIKNYHECINNFSYDLGRMPSEEELLKSLKWKRSKLKRVWKAIAVSDDKIIRNDQYIYDYPSENCEENDIEVVKKYIAVLINKLDKRHGEVIRRRFGIGCECETLESIGDLFGVSKERIRQIETVAMNKMRNSVATTDKCILLGHFSTL